jgi:IPT/TIG domain
VTILGNYFANVTEVLFGQVPATSVKVVSSNRITAVAPPHDAGMVDVQIGTQASTTAAGRFTYLATPEVTEIKPNHGPTRGGTLVIIHGGNFVNGETKVYFGKRLAKDVKVLSSRLLVVKTPADDAGTVMLAVGTPEGFSAEVPFEFAHSSSCVQGR